MSKFIHVDGDDGMITVKDGATTGFNGWIYEVPNNYELVVTLESMEQVEYVYELFDTDERAVLVKKM